LARPIVLIPHLFRLAGVISFRKDCSPPPLYSAITTLQHVLIYKRYEINSNTFYTVGQEKRSTNQNSGVRVDATDLNGNRQTYSGRIEDIWELDYAANFKVPLFRC